MRKAVLFFVLGFFYAFSFAQGYRFTVDLVNVEDDKVKVSCEIPPVGGGSVVYRMPKIVPGTYSIYDFGRFVSDFEAFASDGSKLKVNKRGENGWEISDSDKLSRIEYWVEDTWDSKQKGEVVFEPGGSGFFAGENFTINTHCLFGFFEGRQEEEFEVKYLKPAGFFGSTSLIPVESTDDFDRFQTDRYFDLVDAPIMYNIPDTTTVNIGGAEILFSVYSPNGYLTSAFVKKELTEILLAQQSFLGGKLPIKRYAFVIHLFEGFSATGAYGALEHNYSSLYFLPETFAIFIAQSIRDIAAHEFFHILTPLNIHSKEIHNFDFSHPRMSRHLWLYEGVTEYNSHLVQVQEGLIPLGGFLEVIQDKIRNADGYNDSLPFTKMSQGCLDEYKDEYGNVYEKGALIGMCLDLVLLRQSQGTYSLKNLMEDLAAEYGKDKPFADELLFGKIESMTNPAAGTFLRTYVGGPNPLPLTELLAEVGITYTPLLNRQAYTMGGAEFRESEEGLVEVSNIWALDDFGEMIGYRADDIIWKFNGKKVKWDNFKIVLKEYFADAMAGSAFELVLKRPTGGKMKKVKVSTILRVQESQERYFLTPNPEATPKQLALRKAWLGNYLEE